MMVNAYKVNKNLAKYIFVLVPIRGTIKVNTPSWN